MSIYVRAEFDVAQRQIGDFERNAVALWESAEQEPGTLSYRWFTGFDRRLHFTLEEYADPSAFMAHVDHSAELLARLQDTGDMISLEVYGDIDDEVRAWARDVPLAVLYPDAHLVD